MQSQMRFPRHRPHVRVHSHALLCACHCTRKRSAAGTICTFALTSRRVQSPWLLRGLGELSPLRRARPQRETVQWIVPAGSEVATKTSSSNGCAFCPPNCASGVKGIM